MFKQLTITLLITGLCFSSFGQMRGAPLLADSVARQILEAAKLDFPKFYKAVNEVKTQDTLVKQIRFIEVASAGPAAASQKGIITINLSFISTPRPAYNDNRLIVVLYHEVGHLHYHEKAGVDKRNPEDNEKAAFEYSLLKTKQIAEDGDCLPLLTGLKFMKLRSESNNLKDPHVRALKKMIAEPLYSSYVAYVQTHCKTHPKMQ